METLKNEIKERTHECHKLFSKNVNPKMMEVLSMLGFDYTFVDAQGCYLYDLEGKKFLDFHSGEGGTSLGYNHPDVAHFLKSIMGLRFPNMIQLNTNVLSGLLAEKLLEHGPNHLRKIYFTSTGAEAVESSLKFARCATKRQRILYCRQSFHGLTYGALSVCGDEEFKAGFGDLLPNTTMIEFNDLDMLKNELAKGDVAAFITEPIQGREVTLAKPGYLLEASVLCRKQGALFILDEIQTGLGRTGKFFALEHDQVNPDIVLVAKALSGGLVPVGAVYMTDNIYSKVYSSLDRCYVHHSTYGCNTLAMAAGLATLRVMDRDDLVKNTEKMGNLIMAGLKKLKEKYEIVLDVRGLGLMFAIELTWPSSFTKKLQWQLIDKVGKGLLAQAVVIPLYRQYGIISMVSGFNLVIKFIPPMIITEKEVNYFLDSLDKALDLAQNTNKPWKMLAEIAVRAVSGCRSGEPLSEEVQI